MTPPVTAAARAEDGRLQHDTVPPPLLLVLGLLAMTAPVATDLYLPGFPEMGRDLTASASGVQLTLTTFLIGLASGQLAMGPLSDRLGRRTPLLASTVVCVGAGVVCALAPSIEVLAVARLVQGFAGAGGMAIGRAVIADLVTGRAAARAYTLMLTVAGVAPALAPLVGGLLSGPIGWRGMLWVVAGMCAAMYVAVLVGLPETLSPELRAEHASFAGTLRRVVTCRAFWPPVLTFALAFSVMIAYISASPFVYRNVVGLSSVGYGVAFGINAASLVSAGWLASRLVDRVQPLRLVRAALVVQFLGTATFVLLAATSAPAWLLPAAIFVAVVSDGFVLGNCAALAMSRVREVAGTGSAVLGFCQFALGAVVSPLVGLGGAHSALVPAVVMCTASGLALSISWTALGRARPRG